jgi:hypothetical protein
MRRNGRASEAVVVKDSMMMALEAVDFIDKASTNHWNRWNYSKNWVIVWGP